MIVKEVEENMHQIVNTFNQIIDKTVKSSKQFSEFEIQKLASDLQNDYDQVIESIEKLQLPENNQSEESREEVILRDHKEAVQKFEEAMCRAKMWKKFIHLNIQGQLNNQ